MPPQVIVNAPANATRRVISGLNNDLSYNVTVQAYRGTFENPTLGTAVTSSVPATPTNVPSIYPPTPTNVTVTRANSNTAGQLTVSWGISTTGYSVITAYKIIATPIGIIGTDYVATDIITDNDAAVNETSKIILGLTNGKSYQVTVQTLAGSIPGTVVQSTNTAIPYATAVTGGTPPATANTPPPVSSATAVAVNNTPGSVTVSWLFTVNLSAYATIGGYRITATPTGGGTTIPYDFNKPGTDSYTVTGLQQGTSYNFEVKATTATLTGAATAFVGGTTFGQQATVTAATGGTAPVPTPTIQGVAAGGDRSIIRWTISGAIDRVSRYAIKANSSPASGFPNPQEVTANAVPPDAQAIIIGLTPGRVYTYTVQAIGSEATNVAEATFTTNEAQPVDTTRLPPTPILADPTGAEGSGKATLNWSLLTPSDFSTVNTYTILVTPAPNVAPASVGGDVTTTIVSGLTDGTQYQFRVRAVSNGYEGIYSSPKSFTPRSLLPPSPTNLGVTRASTNVSGELTVSWNLPNILAAFSPITQYQIIATSAADAGLPALNQTFNFAPPTAGATSHIISGLTNGRIYTVTIATSANTTAPFTYIAAVATTQDATPRSQYPQPPVISNVVAENAAFTISWDYTQTSAFSTNLDSFYIRYYVKNSAPSTWPQPIAVGSDQRTKLVAGLSASDTYIVGILSRGATVATTPDAYVLWSLDVTPTSTSTNSGRIPTGVTLTRASTNTTGQLSISWNAYSIGFLPPTGFEINLISEALGNLIELTSGFIVDVSTASYNYTRDTNFENNTAILTGLTDGRTYKARIRTRYTIPATTITNLTAFDTTTPQSTAIPRSQLPQPIGTVTVNQPTSYSPQTVDINWTLLNPTAFSAVLGYRLVATSATPGLTTLTRELDFTPPSTNTTVIDGLTADRIYIFNLKAAATAPTGSPLAFAVGTLFGTDASSSPFTTRTAVSSSPPSPTNLGVTRASTNVSGELTVSWNLATAGFSPITQYQIIATSAAGAGLPALNQTFTFAQPNNGATSHIISGLTDGRIYTVTIATSANATAPFTYIAAVATTQDATPRSQFPNTPVISNVDVGTQSQSATVNWTTNQTSAFSVAQNFVLHYYQNGTLATGASTAPTTNEFSKTINNLINGQDYNFFVRANISGSIFKDSDILTATPRSTLPPTPINVSVTRVSTNTTGQLTVSWALPNTSAFASISGYRITAKTVSYGVFIDTPADIVNIISTPPQNSYVINGLTNGRTYTVKVEARTGTSTYGTGVESSNSAEPLNPLPPPPVISGVNPSDRAVAVTFTAGSALGFSTTVGYEITASAPADGAIPSFSATTTATPGTNNVGNLTNGRLYSFVVTSIITTAIFNTSNTLTATPLSTTVPTPQNLTVTPGNGELEVEWDISQSSQFAAVTGYEIEAVSPADSVNVIDTKKINPLAGATSAIIDNLINGRAYTVSIKVGRGTPIVYGQAVQNPAVTPVSVFPPTLTNLSTTGGEKEVTLTASISTIGFAQIDGYRVVATAPISTGFDVEHKVTKNLPASSFSTSNPNPVVDNLINGRTYSFVIQAYTEYNTNRFYGSSAEVSGTPISPSLATAISTYSTAGANSNYVTVNWDRPVGFTLEDYYTIEALNVATASVVSQQNVLYPIVAGTVENLTAAEYLITLIGTKTGKTSTRSDPIKITPRVVSLLRPTITATAGDKSVTLSWTVVANTNRTGYFLNTTTTGTIPVPLDVNDKYIARDASSTLLSGLTNGQSYTFKLSELGTNETVTSQGLYSTEVSAIPKSNAPPTPVITSLTAGDASVTVNWSLPAVVSSYSAVTDFKITHVASATGTRTLVTNDISGNLRTFLVPNLSNGTLYTFEIYARAAVEPAGWILSEIATTTSTATPRSVAPAPPTVATVTGTTTVLKSTDSLLVGWTLPTDVTQYSPTDSYTLTATAFGATTVTTTVSGFARYAILSNLVDATNYTLALKAFNTGTPSGLASTVAPVTSQSFGTALALPPQPTLEAPVVKDSSVDLSWNTLKAGITGHIVATTTSPGGPVGVPTGITYVPLTNEVGTGVTRGIYNKTITGLSNGQSYGFTVYSVSGEVFGLSSSSRSAIPISNFTATPTITSVVAGDASATVSWSMGSTYGFKAVNNFVITATPPAPNATITVDASSTATSKSVTGLTNGVLYSFAVKAYPELNSASVKQSSVVTATPKSTLPRTPTLGAVIAGNGKILVTWTLPTSDAYSVETGYYIKATAPASSLYSTIHTVDAIYKADTLQGPNFQGTISGLTNGRQYTVSIRAISGTGLLSKYGLYNTAQSSLFVATPTAIIPKTTTFNSFVIGNGEITVSWTVPPAGTSPVVTAHVLTVTTLGSTPVPSASRRIELPGGISGSQAISGLTNGQEYTFTIISLSGTPIQGEPSVKSETPLIQLPPPPLIGKVIACTNSFIVNFDASNNGTYMPLTRYKINITTTGAQPIALANQVVSIPASPVVTDYTMTSLTAGQEYNIKITTENGSGANVISSALVEKDVTLPSVGPPTPIIGNTIAGDGAVTVYWTMPAIIATDIPTSGYLITAYTNATPPIKAKDLYVKPGSFQATLKNLTNSQQYLFTVRTLAVNNTVGGTESSSVTGTPSNTLPAQPVLSPLTILDQKIGLTWTMTSTDYTTGYLISIVPTPVGGSATVTVAGASTLTKEITGLTNGTEYTFRVKATGTSIEGNYSDSRTGIPLFNKPPPVTITNLVVGDANITVRWTNPSAATIRQYLPITGFFIEATPTSSGFTATTLSVPWVPAVPSTGTILELVNGREYGVRVKTQNVVGTVTTDGDWTLVTKGIPVSVDPPIPVLSKNEVDSGFTISWTITQLGYAQIDNYLLKLQAGTVILFFGPDAGNTSRQFYNQVNGLEWTVVLIVGTNQPGGLPPRTKESAPITVRARSAYPPPVTNLTWVPNPIPPPQTVKLKWNPPTASERLPYSDITKYVILTRYHNGLWYDESKFTEVLGTDASMATITGLNDSTLYEHRLFAYAGTQVALLSSAYVFGRSYSYLKRPPTPIAISPIVTPGNIKFRWIADQTTAVIAGNTVNTSCPTSDISLYTLTITNKAQPLFTTSFNIFPIYLQTGLFYNFVTTSAPNVVFTFSVIAYFGNAGEGTLCTGDPSNIVEALSSP